MLLLIVFLRVKKIHLLMHHQPCRQLANEKRRTSRESKKMRGAVRVASTIASPLIVIPGEAVRFLQRSLALHFNCFGIGI